jgi:Tol biopolymer transport system component
VATWSPDGSQVAYFEYKDAWGFTEVTPTAGGPPRRLTRRTDFVFQTAPLWSPDGTRLAVSDWDFTDATTRRAGDGGAGHAAPAPDAYRAQL